MPQWDPDQIWEGQDAYVIGGGDSLRQNGFDWDLIRGKRTIGCNSAFIHGSDICEVVVFGDYKWWEKIGKKGLGEYGGIVVGCSPSRLQHDATPWLLTMERCETAGLGKRTLGWHGNTGSLAMNLALILGAKRVFLLGFDMKVGNDPQAPGRPNWHDLRYEKGNPQVYELFTRQLIHVANTLPTVFPGCEIWNVTDDSELNCFPKVSLEEHFQGKEKHVAS